MALYKTYSFLHICGTFFENGMPTLMGILSFETSPWFFSVFSNDTRRLSRRKARKIKYEANFHV